MSNSENTKTELNPIWVTDLENAYYHRCESWLQYEESFQQTITTNTGEVIDWSKIPVTHRYKCQVCGKVFDK